MLLGSDFDVGLNVSHVSAVLAWREHALSCYPNEAVGAFMEDGSFVALENIHPEPRNFFECPPETYASLGEGLVGLVHSHTSGGIAPSKADMEGQVITDVPWGISRCDGSNVSPLLWWGDSLPIRPLKGRVFVHGVMDCWALIRDWHRLQGITPPDFPRENGWWDKGEDLYMDHIFEAGFERVRREPMWGDVFICSLHSDRRNHGGIVVENGEILHHPGGELSGCRMASRWRQKLDFLVRHKDLPEV